MAKKRDDLSMVQESLRALGLPVDQWDSEIKSKRKESPKEEWRPFTKIRPSANIKGIRAGFEEFKIHPHSKSDHKIARCQAVKKRSGGQQCKAIAAHGGTVCNHHGGGKKSGVLTAQGRLNQKASLTKHGRETRVIRAERALLNAKLKEIDRQMKESILKADITTKGKHSPHTKRKSVDATKKRTPKVAP